MLFWQSLLDRQREICFLFFVGGFQFVFLAGTTFILHPCTLNRSNRPFSVNLNVSTDISAQEKLWKSQKELTPPIWLVDSVLWKKGECVCVTSRAESSRCRASSILWQKRSKKNVLLSSQKKKKNIKDRITLCRKHKDGSKIQVQFSPMNPSSECLTDCCRATMGP